MSVRFLTHEVGSLAKPPWLVKTSAGRPLGRRRRRPRSRVGRAAVGARPRGARRAARAAARRGREGRHRALVEPLRAPAPGARRSRRRLGRRAAAHGDVRVGDRALQRVRAARHRQELRQQVLLEVGRHRPRGAARAVPQRRVRVLQSVAQAKLKIPITGAYTLAVWSYDEHYGSAAERLGAGSPRAAEIAARREFALDIARNIIRPNLEALIELGAEWIQIDEPGASTEPDELEVFVESFNASVEGLDCYFSTHLCFSDYDLFFPAIEGMSGCRQYCVGFANYDTRELGTSAAERPGLPGDRALPRPSVRAGPRRRRARHPHGLRRAARARPRPHPPRGRGLRRPRANPRDARLRPSHAELGGRVREAREHGRRHPAGRAEP